MAEQDQGVTASPPGSQASPEAASASSPSVSIPNAALLSLIGELSHAVYIMLACERCWANGYITTMHGRDECPVCRGTKSAFPLALERVQAVVAHCEALAEGQQS